MTENKNWWAPIWKGLVCDPKAAHYEKMKTAVWLYLFLVLHADRETGRLLRKIRTIAHETGFSRDSINYWLRTLRSHGYITTENTGRCLEIQVSRWKRLPRSGIRTHQKWRNLHTRGGRDSTPGGGLKSLNSLMQSRKMPPDPPPNKS